MTQEELTAKLCADVQLGWHAQEWLALQRQARIAKACQVLNKAHIEGVGQYDMKVDSYAFHSWGQKLGYDCWGDPEFIREYKRDNPAVVMTRPRRGNKVGAGD
jgi:hypothetical protein